ncbi:MAG: hypothetical protein WBG86_11720 [Polyangiales bacterium]
MKRVIVGLSVVCAVACGDSGSEGVPGLYHLPGRSDALSLEIQSEGTFRWFISGCDFFGGDEGIWRRSDDGIVLLPLDGESTFRWSADFRVQEVERLDVAIDADEQGLLITGPAEVITEPQRWIVGGICPICGGSPDPDVLQLGPTGFELCDDPFPSLSPRN